MRERFTVSPCEFCPTRSHNSALLEMLGAIYGLRVWRVGQASSVRRWPYAKTPPRIQRWGGVVLSAAAVKAIRLVSAHYFQTGWLPCPQQSRCPHGLQAQF